MIRQKKPLDLTGLRVPVHVAIIMDGNGRWAEKRGLKRTKGHEQGAETIREITTCCANEPAIETVTFYAFSTENWKRPKLEVEFLMKMLDKYLKDELELNDFILKKICEKKHIKIVKNALELINPETIEIPEFKTLKKINRSLPILKKSPYL